MSTVLEQPLKAVPFHEQTAAAFEGSPTWSVHSPEFEEARHCRPAEAGRLDQAWLILGSLESLVLQAHSRRATELAIMPISAAALSHEAFTANGAPKPRLEKDWLQSPVDRYLYAELMREGLDPHLAPSSTGDYNIAIRIPDTFKYQVDCTPGVVPKIFQQFEACLSSVQQYCKEAAGSYSDQATMTFMKAARNSVSYAANPYEQLLCRLDEVHELGRDLESALRALVDCAYLNRDEQSACRLALHLSTAGAETVACTLRQAGVDSSSAALHETMLTIIRRIGADIECRDSVDEQCREQLVQAALARLDAYVGKVAVIEETAAVPARRAALGVTRVETIETLTAEKLEALEQAAHEAPSLEQLLATPDRKGGVVIDNYYSYRYLKAALHRGAKLITHWQVDKESGEEVLTGFLLCDKGNTDLLCVSSRASLGAACRLIDRLFIELQGSGCERSGAWIFGKNISSLLLSISKGWTPDFSSKRGEWIHGDAFIKPKDREKQYALRQSTQRILEKNFRGAVQKEIQPAAYQANGTAAPEALVPSSVPAKLPNDLPAESKRGILRDLAGRLFGALARERGGVPTVEARSLMEFIELAGDKINLIPEANPEGFWSRLSRGFSMLQYLDFSLRYQSLTASGRVVRFKEKLFTDWTGAAGVGELDGFREIIGQRAYLIALQRRDELRKTLPAAEVEVWLMGSGPMTRVEEQRLRTQAEKYGMTLEF